MKRFWKIFGITLGSIVGVVLLAVVIVCSVVFSPKQLTPIVNRVADSLLTCPHELEEVNLTFFKTFPHFGVSVKGLYVINPMEGAQSDTLLAAPELLVDVNIKQYLDSQLLDIRHVLLKDVVLNPYINADGATNFDVLRLAKDTAEDTTATVLPFNIRLHRLSLTTQQLSFVDEKDSLYFRDLGLRLSAVGEMDSLLHIGATINELALDWSGLSVAVNGTASLGESITMSAETLTVTYDRNSHAITVNAGDGDHTQFYAKDGATVRIGYTINGAAGNSGSGSHISLSLGAFGCRW